MRKYFITTLLSLSILSVYAQQENGDVLKKRGYLTGVLPSLRKVRPGIFKRPGRQSNPRCNICYLVWALSERVS